MTFLLNCIVRNAKNNNNSFELTPGASCYGCMRKFELVFITNCIDIKSTRFVVPYLFSKQTSIICQSNFVTVVIFDSINLVKHILISKISVLIFKLNIINTQTYRSIFISLAILLFPLLRYNYFCLFLTSWDTWLVSYISNGNFKTCN